MRATLSFLLAISLLVLSRPAAADPLRYVGRAFDAASGAPIYTEHHAETRVDDRVTVHDVEYRAPDGSLIASKRIDYQKSLTHPDFRLEDARDGYLEGGELLEDGRYRLFIREKRGEETRAESFEVPTDFVADAGFNQFIRAEWSRLVRGERVTLHFAAPAQLDFFRFRAGRVAEKEIDGRRAAVFRVEVDNALIRLFVDPIELAYDLDTRELLEFAGMANINDSNGKSHVARIVFPDGQQPPGEDVAVAPAAPAPAAP